MENVNTTTKAILRQQQQQQQQHFQLQQEQQQQQQLHENQQQFCLRWHNHQTSLLSSLPVLLDQSHLTDVTISAEGRTLRAHRVVLSACSTFFLELFRALDATNHPVIILPGASFAAIVALLTFMYSGEVNVYEEQIPVLLNLAETLGVKGLADVQSNKSASKRCSMDSSCEQHTGKMEDNFDSQSRGVPPPPPPTRVRSPTPTHTPTPPPQPQAPPLPPPPPPASVSGSAPSATTFNAPTSHQVKPSSPAAMHPFASPLLAAKFPTQLESFFLKSLQFYPNLLPQPLNFSQTALNKTTELLAKYQQQCNLYQGALSSLAGTAALAPKEILSSAGGEPLITQPQRFAAMSPPGKGMLTHEDAVAIKRFRTADKMQSCSIYMQPQQQQQHSHQSPKDAKRIDKIADNLRCGNNNVASNIIGCKQSDFTTNSLSPQNTTALSSNNTNISCNFTQRNSPQLGTTKPLPIYTTSPTSASATAATVLRNQSPQQQQYHDASPSTAAAAFETSTEEQQQAARNLQQQIEQLASCSRSSGGAAGFGVNVSDGSIASCSSKSYDTNNNGSNNVSQQKTSTASTVSVDKFGVGVGVSKGTSALALSTSPGASGAQGKTPSNSKLYATCFICHKQLSNQYNLRVHLETHQNVRYACNVCTHVSRSKDALRKHVSYRHPGAPSPCETEARRKRASKILMGSGAGNTGIASNSNIPSASPPAVTSVSNTLMGAALDSGNSSTSSSNSSEAQIAAAAAHLNSAAAYMFLPNQFHLAAAAAAVVQQQQQQQQQQLQQQSSPQNIQCYNALSTMSSPATPPETDTAQATTCAAAATIPTETATAIKLERQSPFSTEQLTSDSPPPQLQQQQQQTRNGDTDADISATVQRSSPS